MFCLVSVTRSHSPLSLLFLFCSIQVISQEVRCFTLFTNCLNCCNIKADRGLYIDIDTAVPVDRIWHSVIYGSQTQMICSPCSIILVNKK